MSVTLQLTHEFLRSLQIWPCIRENKQKKNYINIRIQQKGKTGNWRNNGIYVMLCFLLGNPRRLNFICRRFGTSCIFHLHRRVGIPMEGKTGNWRNNGIYFVLCFFVWVIPGVWFLYTDVSEHSVYSVFIGGYEGGADRVFRNVGI